MGEMKRAIRRGRTPGVDQGPICVNTRDRRVNNCAVRLAREEITESNPRLGALVCSGCHTVNVTMQSNANVPIAPPLVVTSKGIPKPAIGAGMVAPNFMAYLVQKIYTGIRYDGSSR